MAKSAKPEEIIAKLGEVEVRLHHGEKTGQAGRAIGVTEQTYYTRRKVRGTAVALFAEAGATVPEIAAITGRMLTSANTILEKYLARTPALSRSAIVKFENAEAMHFADQSERRKRVKCNRLICIRKMAHRDG